ncbi:hypothetical protein KEM56_000463 [Ascosphaera pollenicola]|nr:hypothetical protein KEM56_000463 [Ascosphaera pollenicola]
MSSTQRQSKLSDRYDVNETISSTPVSESETADEAMHQHAPLFSPKSRTSFNFIVPLIFDSVLLAGGILHLILVFKTVTIKDASITSSFGRNIEELQKWKLCLMMNSSLIYDPMVNFVYAPFSTFTVILFLLWACSPIGGQSSLRLVHKGNITVTTNEEIRYQDTGPIGIFLVRFVDTRDVYTAAFTQPASTILGPVDSWGNIKIPRIGAFRELSIKSDKNGWYDVKKLPAKLESWSGLYGLPVIGLAQYNDRNISFNVQSAYTAAACGKAVMKDPLNVDSVNITSQLPDDDDRRNRWWTLLGFPNRTPDDTSAEVITAQFSKPQTETNCTITLQPVETQIKCTYGSCSAARIREWKNDPFGGRNYTPFSRTEETYDVISQVCPQPAPCSVELALDGITDFYDNRDAWWARGFKLSLIPSQTLSARYSVILNTLLASEFAGYGLFRKLPFENLSIYGSPHKPSDGADTLFTKKTLPSFGQDGTNYVPYQTGDSPFWPLGDGIPFVGASANATVLRDQEVYNPNYIWCLLSLVSSTSLVILGLSGIYCHCRSLTPNMFDPVIGWTYMNPYISLPPLAEDTAYPLAAERRLGALGKSIVRLGRPHDQAPVPSLDKSGSCETLQGDADESDTKEARFNDYVMSFSPVVLGSADKIQRLRRKDGYQGPAGNA